MRVKNYLSLLSGYENVNVFIGNTDFNNLIAICTDEEVSYTITSSNYEIYSEERILCIRHEKDTHTKGINIIIDIV